MKLLRVSKKDGPSQVEFGKTCSLEELRLMPRFCKLPELRSASSDMARWSAWFARAIGDAGISALGAVTSLVSGTAGLFNNETRNRTLRAGLEHTLAWFAGLGRKA